MPNPIILFDLDDTLNNFADVFWARYNEHHGEKITPEDITAWDLSLFVKPEVGSTVYDLMKLPGLYRSLAPHPDASGVVTRLTDRGYDILFVTDAPSGTPHTAGDEEHLCSSPTDDKRLWVAEHFPQVPKEQLIIMSGKWRHLFGDILIDDNPLTFLERQKNGKACILIDKPYNRHIDTEWRALTLLDAEQKVLHHLASSTY